MSRTHQEIFHLARRLELLVADLPAGGPEPEDLTDLRRLLYGLYHVLRLHFAQEEELYQALGDEPDQAEPPSGSDPGGPPARRSLAGAAPQARRAP
jgi:hypothetical protein